MGFITYTLTGINQVWLLVGCQCFSIGPEWETKEEAERYLALFTDAMNKVRHYRTSEAQ